MDIDGIAGRVSYWRQRRSMTQEDFAARLGMSRSWVQKFESGNRQADPRISVLELIAETLAVPIDILLGVQNETGRECVDATEIKAIRSTLMRPDVITGISKKSDGAVADSKHAQEEASWCFQAYQAAHYSALGRSLPRLIVAAQQATSTTDPGTFATLSSVYHVTSLVLMKFSATDLAWHAADRALTSAHTSGDPATIGLAAQALTYAMAWRGEERAAIDVSTTTAEELRNKLIDLGAPGWSVYGIMFLKAAVAAAAINDGDTAITLLNEARGAAVRIGDRNDFFTDFGVTNCLLHEASILGQLGDYAEAIAATKLINPGSFGALTRERRTHHMIDTAVAYHRVRQPGDALNALLEAERLGEQEVHCRPASREIIGDMLHTVVGSPSVRLRALAKRSGVDT